MSSMTMVKPIRTDQDYEEALKQLDMLFDAEEGTEDADARDVLAVLIEDYEEQHYPIDLPDPVEAIKFRMDQQGLSQKDLVPIIGSKSKVSEVLSKKRPLSLPMIRALNRNLGIPADVLLGERSVATLEKIADIKIEELPAKELAKLGAFDGLNLSNPMQEAAKGIQLLVEKIGGPSALPVGLARKSQSPRLSANAKESSLLAWSIYALALAKDQEPLPPYRPGAIDRDLAAGLAQLSVLEEGPRLAQEFLAKHGIRLVVAPHLKRTYLDGAAFLPEAGKPVVALTLRHDRVDNFWFTLMHELAHLALHLEPGGSIVDDFSRRGAVGDSEREQEADRWAKSALLPEDFEVDDWVEASATAISRYAQEHSRHPGILAGHIQYHTKNYRRYSHLVGRGEVRKWFSDGKEK